MATTFTVTKPVWRGIDEERFVAVKKASTQSFSAGDLVILSSGLATDFSGGSSAVQMAIAGEDASQLEAPSGSPNNTLVDLLLIDDDVTGEMNMSGTFAQTDISTEYGLTTSGGIVVVNKSDTSNKRVKVIQLLQGAVGDTYARVLVRFLTSTSTNVL